MKCYKCKREIPPESKFCPKCGSPQEFTKELIDRAINNDQMAITQLYDMTKDNVYYTIKTMISNEDTAQDLSQDTFLKAMKNLGQLNEPAAFRGWIKKIARNMTIDLLRKRKVITFSQMVPVDSDEAVEFEDDRPENLPEIAIDRQETTRLIGEILDTLSAEQRVVAEMFYYDGLSVKEISQELGVNENTIKSRLKYARNKIEAGVLELEKKGTKLYNLAPIPFLLLLFRSQDAYAAELPDADILQAIQSGSAATDAESGFLRQSVDNGKVGGETAKTAAKTGAGATSKGVAVKVIAGLVATAVIGGAIAGIIAHNREDEPLLAVDEPPETVSATARDYEGYYTSPDTDIALTITPLDDASANVILEDISTSNETFVVEEGTAFITGSMLSDETLAGDFLVMDLETAEDAVIQFALSGNRIIAEAPESYEAEINKAIRGTYIRGEKENTGEKVDVKDFIGTYMNGNSAEAGKITISENDFQSVNVLFEAFRTLEAQEVSAIFEDIGYPFEDGIYIEVSGQRVEFTKGTNDYSYILSVPEALKQSWNILDGTYENEYIRIDDVPEASDEIGRFLGTYAQDWGDYDYFLNLSNEYNGLLHCTVGNDRHGGFLGCEYTEYSINGNELRAIRTELNGENVTDTFILNDNGSIMVTFSEGMYADDGTYEATDKSMYESDESYP